VRTLPEDGHGALAIFDADGTMWRNDVADDFARWMMSAGHVPDAGRWDEYVHIYRQDHAAGCEHMLTFYAGLSLRRLHELIWRWWTEHSRRQWVVEVLEAMHVLAERGYAIWVVTGSPTDTMLPLRDVLPVDRVVGIDFELDAEGVLTGRRQGILCADAGKAEKVRSLWPTAPILFAAGNGSLDAAMMELSTGVAWAVYPNPTFLEVARAHGWHILPRPADFVEETKLA
jgi:HAD superfamily phosphoserine phosphatase-like hydrolase